jgi:predicted alpha/beta superfamily hydrolase
MKKLAALAAIAGLLAGCSPSQAPEPVVAEPVVEVPAPRAYAMPDTEVLQIDSPALGRSYELFVRLPPGHGDAENAERRYPVLYLNDAHYVFQAAAGVTLAPMRHGGLEPMIIVGVSYALGEGGTASRGRDLTPTGNAAQTQHATGEARAFLTFMRDEVIPLVERTYPVDAGRRIFAGQSYGGLFGAYALVSEPGLFSDYILTSPSLWYGNGAMFGIEADAANRRGGFQAACSSPSARRKRRRSMAANTTWSATRSALRISFVRAGTSSLRFAIQSSRAAHTSRRFRLACCAG